MVYLSHQGLTSVCTRSWLERPSLSCSSLRSEFCSFSSCPLQSSTRGNGGEPCSSASPFPSVGPARLLRLIAARGTIILTASTSVQASRLTLPRWSTPRGCGAAGGGGWVDFGLCLGLATFKRGTGDGPGDSVSVVTSRMAGGFSVSMPSPAPRTGTWAEPGRSK